MSSWARYRLGKQDRRTEIWERIANTYIHSVIWEEVNLIYEVNLIGTTKKIGKTNSQLTIFCCQMKPPLPEVGYI